MTKASQRTREKSPFDITRPAKYYPNIVSPRIRAQEGLFIACAEPEKPLDSPLRDGWFIERYEVPSASKITLRYELFRLGVHASSLFPGIDGLAERLKWQHKALPLSRTTNLKSPRVVSGPEILGGTPVFVGSRVPVRILFEHLEAGDALEVFLQDFPSVSRELAVLVLEDAKASLVAA